MKIVILGAGQVGSTVASALVHEDNDITIVDNNEQRLKELQNRLDIRSVLGYASHPKVMERAGIEDADLVIALTSSDEVNMVACQIAYTLYNVPTRIARVRAGRVPMGALATSTATGAGTVRGKSGETCSTSGASRSKSRGREGETDQEGSCRTQSQRNQGGQAGGG